MMRTNTLLAALLCCSALVAQVPNDACSGAIAIGCGQSLDGNTDSATVDTVAFCGTGIEAAGVWYTFTGTGAYISVTTCSGASYDTRLNVYSGSCGNLVCVDGNDDDAQCNLLSTVNFQSVNGTTYYILVQGYDGETGDFTLTIECPTCPPAEDVFISPSDVEAFVFFDPLGATGFTIEHGPTGFTLGTGTLTSGTIGVDGPPVNITGLNDSTDYDLYITLDCGLGGLSAADGPHAFTTLELPPPANAFCADALPIVCGDTLDGTTEGSIVSIAPECGSANVNTAGVWYYLVGDGDEVTLSTCNDANFDSKISVFAGNCNALTCVAGNDDGPVCNNNTSVTTFVAELGVSYWVLVHGYNGAVGNFSLSASCNPPCSPALANDDCDSPTVLVPQPIDQCAPTVATLVCAYASPLPNPGCDPFENVNDAWFVFNTGLQTEHTIITALGDATTLSVALYEACSEPDYIACFTDSIGEYTFSGLDAGTDYFIRVWNGGGVEAGDFTICVETALPDGVVESGFAQVQMYPTPTRNELNIVGLPNEVKTLNIVDLAGRRASQVANVPGALMRLDVAGLAPGIYMLTADAGVPVGRFVVER